MKTALRTFFICCLTLISLTVFAHTIQAPWFIGPLLANSGETVPVGHINVQPFFIFTDNYGFYNRDSTLQPVPNLYSFSPFLDMTVGLTKRMDIQTFIPYVFQNSQGKSANGFADITVLLGYQFLYAKMNSWMPDLRVTLEETFPTGKYDNLDPFKAGTDGIGQGAYQTTISFNFQKLIQCPNGHYLNLFLDLAYTIPTSVNVNELNVYGGGIGTNGRVNVGNLFTADLAMEYALTQHLATDLDIFLAQAAPDTFHGMPGLDQLGQDADIGNGSSYQVSLAPALEYNFSKNIGIIGGCWFSIIGRNSPAFLASMFSVNFYY